MAALCPHCGGKLDSPVFLCPFCRNPVDEPPADEAWERAPARRGGSGAFTKLLFGLALLGGGLVAHRKGLLRKPAAPPEAPSEAPAAPRAAETPRPPAESRLLVRGKVYDLMTLEPIPGARISFRDKRSGGTAGALTRTDGRYEVRLPRREDARWDVSASHPRYGDRFLEEGNLPYASMPRTGRAAARDMLYSPAALLHVPLSPDPDAEKLDYDLVMSRP